MARAIQFFCPGIPQVYYVGLLAGENDMDLLSQTQVGRDINRHYYSAAEIDEHLERDIVKDLIALIKFRNTHPSFQGNFRLIDCPEKELNIKWENGEYWSHLKIDLKKNKLSILCNDRDGNGVSLDFITFSK
jgi:sucrose phosphorylase